MKRDPVRIAGAGLAGLSAALGLARHGWDVQVFEKKGDSGTRWSRWDVIENWTTPTDFMRLVKTWGLDPFADVYPISEFELYNDQGECYPLHVARPLFYLVQRGTDPDSLEQGLKAQALNLGVNICYDEPLTPAQADVWAVGPQTRGFFVSAGLVFQTSHPDSFKILINTQLAPKAYAYLIIFQGQATLSVVLTQQFRQARTFLDQTLAVFQRIRPFDMSNVHSTGGSGGMLSAFSQPHIAPIRIGEAAGFQDYLWGFGIRHALFSGTLAARSITEGIAYAGLIEHEIRPLLHSSLINRLFYEHANAALYRALIQRFSATQDLNRLLYHAYRAPTVRRLLWPITRHHYAKSLN